MKGTAYLTGRVCQYTDTPDGDYIIDRHPEAENAWIYGGGSGTGFHAGPHAARTWRNTSLDTACRIPGFPYLASNRRENAFFVVDMH